MTPHITETPSDGDNSGKPGISGRAETTAGLERQGNYDEAARWWRMAADTARPLPQRHWCESRASLCERYRQVPLSQPVTS